MASTEHPVITIRPLRDTDDVEWMRLRFALWNHYTVEAMQAEMASLRADITNQPVFVAERPDGGGLCGLVEVAIHTAAPGCTTDRIGYLEAWYVDPDYRSQGLGRRLVETAEAWARLMGCREIASDTTSGCPLSPAAHAALGYQIAEIYFRKDLL
jgi:aminoglycoside 6'-N-acetyltransferase I